MSSTDKNFIRNLCLAAGLFFAFLLVAPVKYGPSTTVLEEKPDHVSEVDSATEVATTTSPTEIMDSSNGLVSATDFLIPVTIGNDTHRLSVNKDKKNIPQLATDICNDNSAALGFKEGDDVMSLCIQPVSNSLDKQVDLKLQQLVSVDVDVNGRSVTFEIDKGIESSSGDQAGKFCSGYGHEFGVTQDNLDQCILQVKQAIESKLSAQLDTTNDDEKNEAQMFQVDLDIHGNTVRFDVEANYESIGQQAAAFCNNHGPKFGVTQDTLSECQQNIQGALENRIVAYLESQQIPVSSSEDKAVESPKFQMDLDIQGSTVRFEVEANYESIGQQATTFCTTHGPAFGVTQETLGECQQNIQRALEERIVAHLEAEQRKQEELRVEEEKVAPVPTFQMDLDIQGSTVRFEVEANYESIGQQATTFCTTHGPAFGVTQETLGECQQNIQRALEERIVSYLSSNK